MVALAGLSLAAWLYLLAFRGGFWSLTERESDLASADAPSPKGLRVTAIVPARDEAQVIDAESVLALRAAFRRRVRRSAR